MSNLRSDCRDLVKELPAGDTWRVHVERLCYQIDELEERWHEAERKLHLWNWLAEMRCTVHEAATDGPPRWYVADVDDEVIGSGPTPLEAIQAAKAVVEGQFSDGRG